MLIKHLTLLLYPEPNPNQLYKKYSQFYYLSVLNPLFKGFLKLRKIKQNKE